LLQQIHGVDVDCLYLLEQGATPKTTSGKLRRVETRRRCLETEWPANSIVQSLTAKSQSKDQRGQGNTLPLEIPGSPSSGIHEIQDFDSIVISVLCKQFDATATWEENGLSSMVSLNLQDSIEKRYNVLLPVDWLEQHPTPLALKQYVESGSGTALETSCQEGIASVRSMHLSPVVMGVCQGIGIALLLLLFSVSIIPAWHVYNWLSNDSTKVLFDAGPKQSPRFLVWMWLPFSVPVWLLSFTTSVIVSKWLIIGKYKESQMPINTLAYLRWWWVDRAMAMFEWWVGRFLLDTIFLTLVYRFLGAHIHLTVRLQGFVREFDLVTVETESEIKHTIRCRKFTAWEQDKDPFLQFRKIFVGKKTSISGLLGPGATVGDGSRVEHFAAVCEDGIVPANTLVTGSPAFNAGPCKTTDETDFSLLLECFKAVWCFMELYNFFALILVAQFFYYDMLPASWHYSKLCYWFLYVATVSVLSVIEMIFLKWILVGRRRPGPKSQNICRRAALWAADFHYTAMCGLLISVTSNSSALWITVLKLMGGDFDYGSTVNAINFPPSTVDLISVKGRSFLAFISLGVEQDGYLCQTKIEDSSVGIHSRLEANITVSNAVVPPFTLVDKNLSSTQKDRRGSSISTCDNWTRHVVLNVLYILTFGIALLSLVPVYDMWMRVFRPNTIEEAVPVLAVSLIMQTIVWFVILRIIQLFALGVKTNWREGKASPVHLNYLTILWAAQTWSFLPILYGTPYFNVLAFFMGAKQEGRVIFFGSRLYDWPYISIADRTLVDDGAMISGHSQVFEETAIGPVRLAGLIHEDSWISVGAYLRSSDEVDPFKAIIDVSALDANTKPEVKTRSKKPQ
jgi:carbonic anhydrase/acetyltransferase-like protein (isoleucine patch superfamily)